jgi:hypothetical protein
MNASNAILTLSLYRHSTVYVAVTADSLLDSFIHSFLDSLILLVSAQYKRSFHLVRQRIGPKRR